MNIPQRNYYSCDEFGKPLWIFIPKGTLSIYNKIPAWRFEERFINKGCSLVFYPTHEGELYARDLRGVKTRIEGKINIVKGLYMLQAYDGYLAVYRVEKI